MGHHAASYGVSTRVVFISGSTAFQSFCARQYRDFTSMYMKIGMFWLLIQTPQEVVIIILGIQILQGGLAENVSRIIVLNLNYGCLTATETCSLCCLLHDAPTLICHILSWQWPDLCMNRTLRANYYYY